MIVSWPVNVVAINVRRFYFALNWFTSFRFHFDKQFILPLPDDTDLPIWKCQVSKLYKIWLRNSYQVTESRSKQTQPDQTIPNQTHSDPIIPNQTQPDPTRPNQTQPDPTRPNQTQPDPMRPNQTQPDQTRPKKLLSGDTRVEMFDF